MRAADGREQTPLDEQRESSGTSTGANDVSEARSEPPDPRSRGLASTGALLHVLTEHYLDDRPVAGNPGRHPAGVRAVGP